MKTLKRKTLQDKFPLTLHTTRSAALKLFCHTNSKQAERVTICDRRVDRDKILDFCGEIR